jgi:hypothetical protein
VILMKLYWHPAMSLAKLNKILVILMKLYWRPAMQVMYKVVLVVTYSTYSTYTGAVKNHDNLERFRAALSQFSTYL